MDNIYLHGINHRGNFIFYEKEDLEILEEILASQYILSRKLQEKINKRNKSLNKEEGFNGSRYISLCDYDLRDAPPYNNNIVYQSYNSYKLFIEQLISIIINKENIKVIKPVIVNPLVTTWENIGEMRKDPQYKNACFSDLPDEVQVKDKISLDYMEGITIPLKYFKFIYINSENDYDETLKRAIALINKIDELLTKYNRKNKIYNLEDFQELKTTDDIEKALRKVINK